MIKNELKSMVFFACGAWSSACRELEMQRFDHTFGFFCIGDKFGGLVDAGWTITGPWKQWGLAKHIAKPSK